MIQCEPLSFNYNPDNDFSFPEIQCKGGEELLILGESGCGKTTLLHLMAGLLQPKQGKIIINNQDIHQFNATQLDKFRGQHIGMVFQVPHFIQALTVKENLQLAQKLAGKSLDNKRINYLLESLNIGKKANTKTYQLSQGERQRVSIARALVNQPAIVLADEPTSALDDTNAEEVFALISEQTRAQKSALLIVTHDNRLKDLIPKRISL